MAPGNHLLPIKPGARCGKRSGPRAQCTNSSSSPRTSLGRSALTVVVVPGPVWGSVH